MLVITTAKKLFKLFHCISAMILDAVQSVLVKLACSPVVVCIMLVITTAKNLFKSFHYIPAMILDAVQSVVVLCMLCLCSIGQRPPDLISAFTLFRNKIRYQKKSLESSIVDLREHKLFNSDVDLDCCPTKTEVKMRTMGINPQGILLELFFKNNFTQSFYETFCHADIKDRRCQFIDPRYAPYSRCVQQYSYVYALGRTFLRIQEQFRIDYIRIATGCKCQLVEKDAVQDLVGDLN